MNLPKIGEWWICPRFDYFYPRFEGPSFIIEDVIEREPFADSWVIYSNNDNSGDYFVTQMWEFIQGRWEKADGAGKLD